MQASGSPFHNHCSSLPHHFRLFLKSIWHTYRHPVNQKCILWSIVVQWEIFIVPVNKSQWYSRCVLNLKGLSHFMLLIKWGGCRSCGLQFHWYLVNHKICLRTQKIHLQLQTSKLTRKTKLLLKCGAEYTRSNHFCMLIPAKTVFLYA